LLCVNSCSNSTDNICAMQLSMCTFAIPSLLETPRPLSTLQHLFLCGCFAGFLCAGLHPVASVRPQPCGWRCGRCSGARSCVAALPGSCVPDCTRWLLCSLNHAGGVASGVPVVAPVWLLCRVPACRSASGGFCVASTGWRCVLVLRWSLLCGCFAGFLCAGLHPAASV
jgi:hypothetical protein